MVYLVWNTFVSSNEQIEWLQKNCQLFYYMYLLSEFFVLTENFTKKMAILCVISQRTLKEN